MNGGQKRLDDVCLCLVVVELRVELESLLLDVVVCAFFGSEFSEHVVFSIVDEDARVERPHQHAVVSRDMILPQIAAQQAKCAVLHAPKSQAKLDFSEVV